MNLEPNQIKFFITKNETSKIKAKTNLTNKVGSISFSIDSFIVIILAGMYLLLSALELLTVCNPEIAPGIPEDWHIPFIDYIQHKDTSPRKASR